MLAFLSSTAYPGDLWHSKVEEFGSRASLLGVLPWALGCFGSFGSFSLLTSIKDMVDFLSFSSRDGGS